MIEMFWLLSPKMVRVGKYFVNLTGCRFAADRLKNALISSDVIVCDEIGPMELNELSCL